MNPRRLHKLTIFSMRSDGAFIENRINRRLRRLRGLKEIFAVARRGRSH
jgi:hypothetical protein